jgi:hypothetical protein
MIHDGERLALAGVAALSRRLCDSNEHTPTASALLSANAVSTTGEMILPPTASIGPTAIAAPMMAINGARNESGKA